VTQEAQRQAQAAAAAGYPARRIEAMREVRRLIEEIDPEAAVRMDKAGRGRTPSTKEPDRGVAFLAEAVAVLAAAVVEQAKPRKRGRPPKAS
jgi:hypothetical protein